MYCQKCGKEIPDTSSFCLHCGGQVTLNQNEPSSYSEVRSAKFPVRSAVIVVITIGAIMIGANAYQQYRSKETASRNSYQLSQIQNIVPALKPTPYWEKASTGRSTKVFTVEPRNYLIHRFSIDEKWRNARFQGRFRAEGGSGNDVMVWITDEDGLENFKNRHSFNIWYESGKTTIGKFDVQLAPGNYYLLISNTFSVFANKVVNMEMEISFEYLKQP